MTIPAAQPDTVTNIRRLIVRRRWSFILPFFAASMAVLVIAGFLPRKYEGQAIFENRNDLVMTEIANRGAPQQFARLKRSIGEEVGGAAAIERAVTDLQLVPTPPATASAEAMQRAEIRRQDYVNAIRRELRVSFDVSTAEVDRVRLTLIHTNPELTRRVVNKLVENYVERSRKQVGEMLDQASVFFRGQVERQRKELDRLEEQRLKFEVRHANVLPEDGVSAHGSLAEAEQQLLGVEQAMRAAEQRVAALERELPEADRVKKPASVVMQRNPELKRLQDELREYNTRIEKATVLDKMTDAHPTVITLRRKIDDLEGEIAQTPAEIVAERVFREDTSGSQVNLALVQARADRDAARASLKVAQQHVAKLLTRSTEIFPVRSEYRKISWAINEAQRQLDFWNDNLRRIQITLTAELGQRGIAMEVLKLSGPITRPTSPDLMQVLFVALAMGIAFGSAWVVLSERSDSSFQAVDDITRHVGVPVYGAVAEIVTARDAMRRALSRFVFQPTLAIALAALLVGAAYSNYVSLRKPQIGTASVPSTIEPDRALQTADVETHPDANPAHP